VSSPSCAKLRSQYFSIGDDAVAPGERVARLESLNAREHRARTERRMAREILGQRRLVERAVDDTTREDRLDLRAEVQRAVFRHRVVQRLHAEAVARDEQRFLLLVPDREREHAAQVSGVCEPCSSYNFNTLSVSQCV
jgi:hypothetical protein